MARYPSKKKGYLLPDVIDPERIGVCVPVPNDPNHIRAFMGALYELTWYTNWSKDDPVKNRAVTEVWKEIHSIVRDRIGSEICEGGEPLCVTYPNTAPFIQFGPADPRYDPDRVPDGYASPPWYFSTAVSELALGSHPGDILTSFERLPIVLPTWPPTAPYEWPWIKVSVSGIGKLEIHLRNLVLGSMFIVTRSDDPLFVDFVDVNRDVAMGPPEIHQNVILEYDFETDGDHWVQLNIIPTIDVNEVPINYGGGISHVVLCGFNQEGVGMDCCDDILTGLAQLKSFFSIQENEQREDLYDGTPESVNEDAPPDVFAGGTGGIDLRSDALCLAIRTYVFNQIIKRVERDCGNANAIVSLLLGAAGGALGGPIGGIVGGVVGLLISGLICEEIAEWAQDDQAINDTVCQIYNALYGVEVSQSAFALAFAQLAGDGFVYEALSEDANQQENYLYFLDLLGAAYGQAELGVEGDCDECQELLCGPFDYRESFPVGGQIFSYDNVPVCGARIPGKGMVNTGGPTTTGRYAVAWRHPLNCDQPGSEVWNVHITYENFVTISGDRRIYVWLKDQAGNWIDKLHAGMTTTVGVHNVSIPSYDMTADGSSGPPVEIWVQMVEIVQQSGSAIRSITLQNVP